MIGSDEGHRLNPILALDVPAAEIITHRISPLLVSIVSLLRICRNIRISSIFTAKIPPFSMLIIAENGGFCNNRYKKKNDLPKQVVLLFVYALGITLQPYLRL
jgi:hypothetical protein